MGRRRAMGDVITLEYNGRELTFREDMDEWSCSALKLEAKSLSALKRKVDKLDGEARRVSLPVLVLDRYGGGTEGRPANIVMIAKHSDWDPLRFDEKPELLAGLHSRRTPTVWVMIAKGNHPAERHKKRLDDCALPTESAAISLREAERLSEEARRLQKQAEAIVAAIPRVTIDDLNGRVAEENLED